MYNRAPSQMESLITSYWPHPDGLQVVYLTDCILFRFQVADDLFKLHNLFIRSAKFLFHCLQVLLGANQRKN